MTLVQNHLQQLNGNKNKLILILILSITLQSCSVFESIFGKKNPPPPPPPHVENKDKEPGKEVEVEIEPETKDTIVIPDKPVIVEKEKINIGVVLPFQLDKIDAGNNIPTAAQYSLELYKGIRFAIDEADQSEFDINIYMIDNDGNANKSSSVVGKNPFPDVDLVIGPLYSKSIREIGDFAIKNKIPFISPLSSSSSIASNNSYIYSANATMKSRYERMFQMISKEFINANVGVFYQPIKAEEEAKIELLQVAAEQKIDITAQLSEGRSTYSAVNNLLEKGRENVIIVPVDDNEEGIRYFDQLLIYVNGLAENYDINVIGLKEWNDVPSIAPQKYPKVDIYVLDRFLDSSNSRFAPHFAKLQAKNQNRPLHIYCLQAYDIMNFVLSLIDHYGRDFNQHLIDNDYSGMQTIYHFDKYYEKGEFKFYDNKYINILHYVNGKWVVLD